MSKKIPLGLTIALILISVIVSSCLSTFIFIKSYSDLLNDLPLRASQYKKLENIDELVRSEYFGSINSSDIDQGLVSGYINGLDNDYCYFIAPEDVESFNYLQKGVLPGVGVTAFYDSESGFIKVSYVYSDSPADNAGITENSFITKVNGKDVNDKNSGSLLTLINDDFDSKVDISYYLSDSPENIIDVTVNSGYSINSCYYSINGNVGYIRFSAFYENTVETFKKAIEHFTDNSISAIILDLRNCNGSDFDCASKIIDIIVPVGNEGTGSIFSAKNTNGDIVYQYNSDADTLNFSFACLINDRTESAAELIACDLRDFGKAILIGEKSAGIGTLQKLFQLEDGSAVSLTVAEIFPYISPSYNNVGVTPDVEILTSDSFKNQIGSNNFSEDEQYNKAYSYLTGQ